MSPWNWRPSLTSWFRQINDLAANWRPKTLAADQAHFVRDAIRCACNAKAAWLYHPFMSALTTNEDSECRPSDVQSIAWVALNCPELEAAVEVGSPERLLSSQGEEFVVEGDRSTGELALLMEAPKIIPARCGGRICLPILARFNDMATESHYCADREQIDAYASDTGRMFSAMPFVGEWISETAKMAVALPPPADGSFASSSSPDVPGLIRLSVGGDILQLLEAIVHESAHLYLFRFEHGGRLVKEDCTTAFASPLRADPRPLRGVLLAMHACAYISAAFAEAGIAGLDHPRKCKAQKLETLELFDQAWRVVDTATELLTEKGVQLVERTRRVASFARSQ